MSKIYLVVIDVYDTEENSIVNICSTLKKAEELKSEYEETVERTGGEFTYHIDEVELDESKEILWDCYTNSSFTNAE